VKDATDSCPQYECITPLRVLLKKERDPERWKREVEVMETHFEDRKKSELWEVCTLLGILGILRVKKLLAALLMKSPSIYDKIATVSWCEIEFHSGVGGYCISWLLLPCLLYTNPLHEET